MKSLSCGIIVVVALFSASPAAACDTCRFSGLVCGTYGCSETYTCTNQTGPCSQCYEVCAESGDQGCSVSLPCQWAVKPLTEQLFAEKSEATSVFLSTAAL
jgi:hypothetical protein